MDFCLQAHSRHSQRVHNPALTIYNIFLYKGMNNLAIHWNSHSACGFDNMIKILFGDLLLFKGNNPMAVKTLDMTSRDTGINSAYLTAGHCLSFFNCLLYGIHSMFDVDNHPFS